MLLGCAAGAGLITYTWFKRRWWGGPFYNAWIVVILFIMGYEAAGGMAGGQRTASLAAPCGVVLFGYANFVLAGYFKDIGADRATGYRTLPVIAGRNIAAVVSDFFAAASVVAAIMIYAEAGSPVASDWRGAAAVCMLAAGTGAAVLGQVRLHLVRTDDSAHRAIIPGLYSYCLLLSGISVIRQPGWVLPLVAFNILFAAVLHNRPETHQV